MKNLKKIIATSLCAGILSISAVSAAGYAGYKLPRFQGNNYTNSHSKTTSANYITNKLENVEGTSTVTFWACNSTKRQISNDYDQKKGSTANIKFTTSRYAAKGKEIIMGMENANFSPDTAFCAGTVNYR